MTKTIPRTVLDAVLKNEDVIDLADEPNRGPVAHSKSQHRRLNVQIPDRVPVSELFAEDEAAAKAKLEAGPKYPNIKVQLTGEDGNAFFIIGRVQRALKEAGVPASEIALYQAEAMTGCYLDLLATTEKWVSVS